MQRPAAQLAAISRFFEVGHDAHLGKAGFAQPGLNALGRSRASDAAAEPCRISSQLSGQWRNVDDAWNR
jgi:hypothetical protein